MTQATKEEIKDDTKGKTNTKTTRTRKQTGDADVQKATPTHETGKGLQQNSEEVDISPYVSNVDGSIYAISGLPEEFIATLFAWVSRSSKSFKEHLQIALKDQDMSSSLDAFKQLDEKAKKFHEKWTVGYGHSSVAEHAVAHVGIESISRLASAELELSNTFLSITEYSQRYQKPERGKWHNPFSAILVGQRLDKPSLHEELDDFYNKSFDAFEKLIEGVYTHLKREWVLSGEYEKIRSDQKKVDRKLDELMKLAFEDARYVLPLSMHTQLGMTANGRAWRDALATLGNSKHVESKEVADDLRTEITKVLPVLLKYATPSQYQTNAKMRVSAHFNERNESLSFHTAYLRTIKSEEECIKHLVALLMMENDNMPYGPAMQKATFLGKEKREAIIKDVLHEMQHFDMAPEVFKNVRYDAELLVSEANWHQLLRHNRKTDFTFSNPSPYFGIKMPPRLVEAGLQDIMKDIAGQSEELYTILVERGFDKEAEYVVLNAHYRHVFMSFSLWEAYHLINLRTSDEAQWDIRETFEDLFKQLNTVHPLLISQAKRRL